MSFELGEGHFDGIEVGAVGWQEQEPCASSFEDGLGLLAFVAGEVIQDDDVTRLKCRRELRLHIGFEDFPVHRAVDDPGHTQTVAPQRRNERLRLPMPEWRVRSEALSSPSPSAQPRHLRRGRRLVDEYQAVRLLTHPRLAVAPPDSTLFSHIIAAGFACQQCFF